MRNKKKSKMKMMPKSVNRTYSLLSVSIKRNFKEYKKEGHHKGLLKKICLEIFPTLNVDSVTCTILTKIIKQQLMSIEKLSRHNKKNKVMKVKDL